MDPKRGQAAIVLIESVCHRQQRRSKTIDSAAIRERLESAQIAIYFAAVVLGAVVAVIVPGAASWEVAINPALAMMLFVTFLQVPLAELGRAFGNVRFLGALLATNFVFVPLLVAALIPFAPANPIVRLGILLVLLCPCIDYVVTFAHLGRADAKLLLAATPVLLVVQMLLLPVYLHLFLGAHASRLVQPGPFVHAFVWLIVIPLALAVIVQFWARRSRAGECAALLLGLLPVPATALVLLIVIAAVMPQLGQALTVALGVIPIYVAFAIVAPLLGWAVSRLVRLDVKSGRALAFSAATRNSLVVLPLALTVPAAVPLLPAVIVAQTLIELVASLIFIRAIPRLGSK